MLCIDVTLCEFHTNLFLSHFVPLRESRRAPDPSLSRACGSSLQRHPFRLDSGTLPLLQRWGLFCPLCRGIVHPPDFFGGGFVKFCRMYPDFGNGAICGQVFIELQSVFTHDVGEIRGRAVRVGAHQGHQSFVFPKDKRFFHPGQMVEFGLNFFRVNILTG